MIQCDAKYIVTYLTTMQLSCRLHHYSSFSVFFVHNAPCCCTLMYKINSIISIIIMVLDGQAGVGGNSCSGD